MDERFNQDCGDCIDKECKNTGMVGRIPDTDTCCVVNDEPQNTEAVKSKSNDGLYGAVQWINDNPVLDGMPYFETKEDCLNYTNRMEARNTPPGIEVRYTIIRLERTV